ncbi:MAG: WD40 repeat domain-containing protein [Methanothrix sp.]|nr:WD40 repeat domain-containing protein [Methanothrix sp.]
MKCLNCGSQPLDLKRLDRMLQAAYRSSIDIKDSYDFYVLWRSMASNDNTLKVWDLESGKEVRTLVGHQSWVRAVALTGDGRRAVSASDDKTLKVWDLESGKEVRTLEGHQDWVRAVALTGDGRRAVSASDDGTLKIWDLVSGSMIASITGDSYILSCAIAPDGLTIVAGEASGRVHFLHLEGYALSQESKSHP